MFSSSYAVFLSLSSSHANTTSTSFSGLSLCDFPHLLCPHILSTLILFNFVTAHIHRSILTSAISRISTIFHHNIHKILTRRRTASPSQSGQSRVPGSGNMLCDGHKRFTIILSKVNVSYVSLRGHGVEQYTALLMIANWPRHVESWNHLYIWWVEYS